jgi:hypothetical protein
MLWAEELGPVGWSAVAGSILAAVVAAASTLFNLRRAASRESAEDSRKDEDRLLSHHRELYERIKKQCDEEKAELNLRIEAVEKRATKLERTNARLWNIYLQEMARRRYFEGVLKQHKIEVEPWDGTTTELPNVDSDQIPTKDKDRPPAGE